MADYIPGRMADVEGHAHAGALFPVKYCATAFAIGIGVTHIYRFLAAEAGRIRHISAHADLNGGTVTLDVLKNGVSVLAATHSLTDETPRVLEGLGDDVAGEDRDINTNVAANIAALQYTKGDTISISLAAATAASQEVTVALTCDERQPKTKPDRS